jgi:Ca2+-binding RTX toxin-like protein
VAKSTLWSIPWIEANGLGRRSVASGYSLGATNLTTTGGGNVIRYGGTAAKNTLTAAGSGDDILIGNGSSDALTDTGSGMNILIGRNVRRLAPSRKSGPTLETHKPTRIDRFARR